MRIALVAKSKSAQVRTRKDERESKVRSDAFWAPN